MSARFITFEGPEGGGKSTQIASLAGRLRAAGNEVVVTREPGGTATGEAIRGILQHDTAGEALAAETELLLFAASRAQLVRMMLLPALARGAWVLCDRFADSTTAYQGYGRQLDLNRIAWLNAMAMGECRPHLTILLDVPVEVGFRRLTQRQAATATAHDRMEREAQDFHERVRAGFLELARREPERIRRIDATQAPEVVAEEIWRLFQHELAG
ncbi:MAG: dTMP kinase [bacterium]